MSYAQDLPYEFLCLVFELSVEHYDPTNTDRFNTLNTASLTCRSWRAPAQAALWKRLKISSQAFAHSLLNSPALGFYATPELQMDGLKLRKGGVSAVAANRVMSKVYGVRVLELRDFQSLGVKIFEASALDALETLVLSSVFTGDPTKISSLRISFRLRSLILLHIDYPPALVTRLLSSSSKYLSHLTLSLLPSSRAYSALVESFHYIGPSLTILDIRHAPTPALINQLHHCTNLRELICVAVADVPTILEGLAHATLLDLSIEFSFDKDTHSCFSLIRKHLISGVLQNLRQLYVRHAVGPISEEHKLLRLACEERGVELHWTAIG